MIKIGQFNALNVIKMVPFGVYLDGDRWGNILLPKKYVPEQTKLHDAVNVFIYFDSTDKIIATTREPFITLGQCALLHVVDVNHVGAFLDWGLEKDLLAPRSEQQRPMEKNKSYIVCMKQDYHGRLIASSKIDYHLDKTPMKLSEGDEVNVLLAQTTDLGTKVIINDSHWGLIHASDLFQTPRYGTKTRGYIKAIREDGKVDVVLRKFGRDHIHELADRVLATLQQANGFLPLHDKSPAIDIQQAFNESKKSFKSAIGYLYKQGAIAIENQGIRLQKK